MAPARLLLLAAAVLFSTGGAAIKACSLSGWQVAALRSGVAALALPLLTRSARRRWSRADLLVGLAYAATLVLFVLANKLTTSANTIFLQSTAPLYILALGPWLLSERVSRSDLVFMAVVAVGLAMFFVDSDRPQSTAPDPWTGNLLAAASGVCWAATVVGLRWLATRGSSASSCVVVGNLLACLACLPFALPMGDITLKDGAIVAFLGVFQIGLAYALVTSAIARVSALESSLLLLAEPALNPIWAYLVLSEAPGTLPLAGGGLILAATLARAVRRE